MTRPGKKARERFFAEQAAKSLGRDWILSEDRENPDFLVKDGASTFGLEVSELFIGAQNTRGAIMKRDESTRHKRLDALRQQYEAQTSTPLIVKFVGDIGPEKLTKIVPALLRLNLPNKPIGYHEILDHGDGLRVHVTRSFHPEWYSVNDRVGFVDAGPELIIANAIEDKSKNLARYRSEIGDDVRLLLFADRIQNSGKMTLSPEPMFDLCGFSVVYFYPYPEHAMQFI
jgi:hypothetical protein